MGITDKLRHLLGGDGAHRQPGQASDTRGRHAAGAQPPTAGDQPAQVPNADQATWSAEPAPRAEGEPAAEAGEPDHGSPGSGG
jgi:hypothetical protein